jgi:hypothetical protein
MDSLEGRGVTVAERTPPGGTAHSAGGNSAPERPDNRPGPWPAAERFLGLSDEELSAIDPVVMNLAVAKGIPALADLDIGRYVGLVDQWAAEIRALLPDAEIRFARNPAPWNNDPDLSRLGLVAWYLGEVLRVEYREDQRDLERVLYTDPTDLFLNGVMDTRRGTCGNMVLLFVVLARRLGWPVSLACVGPHFIARFDDGQKVLNVEATVSGDGRGLSSPPDRYFVHERSKGRIPQRAVDCGSDLRGLTPREMLAVFFGARARHLENVHCFGDAERDYLVARYLFPRNRQLYINQNQVSVQNSMDLFDPGEKGHPIELATWLRQVVEVAPWTRRTAAAPPGGQIDAPTTTRKDECHVNRCTDAALEAIFGGSG